MKKIKKLLDINNVFLDDDTTVSFSVNHIHQQFQAKIIVKNFVPITTFNTINHDIRSSITKHFQFDHDTMFAERTIVVKVDRLHNLVSKINDLHLGALEIKPSGIENFVTTAIAKLVAVVV